MRRELDRRIMTDDDIREVSASEFFNDRFPAMAAANGSLVAAAMRQLDARPLSIETPGETWTITQTGDRIRALASHVDDALVITMDALEFSDWCQNLRSINFFNVARTLRSRGGNERDASIWDSLTLTLLYGWPTVGKVDFLDRRGAPLELERCFTPTDDPADVAHFLREAGFLHLRGWADPALMPQISADMDRTLPLYVEGDGKSWWAQTQEGDRVCVRLQEFVEHSPATVAMLTSEKWDLLRRTIGDDTTLVQPPIEGRCVEALIKPIGIVSGPSDLPFHRDCHLGKHAFNCCGVTVGVALTGSDASNGQLRVIPGSHRIAMPVAIAMSAPYLPPQALTTQPGDLTIHLSCTLHEATAPRNAERRVMYTNFNLPPLPTSSDRPASGEDALSELRERVSDLDRKDLSPARHS
jgi:Phytanoyl-CoA dioxygenase (PhyH)